MTFLLGKVFYALRTASKTRSTPAKRAASTYEGDGKTTGKVLNKDLEIIMVSAISQMGFRLNSGIRLLGPSIIFPRTFLSWNISGVNEVHDDSLSLLTLLCPKVDILVFGYGDKKSLPREVELRVLEFSQKRKIGLEMMPTEKAVPTFNYLAHEKRFVVGAFIPPKTINIYDDGDLSGHVVRQNLLDDE